MRDAVRLNVSAAVAACDVKAESPLPIGRGGVRRSASVSNLGRRCVDALAFQGGPDGTFALNFREGGNFTACDHVRRSPLPKTVAATRRRF